MSADLLYTAAVSGMVAGAFGLAVTAWRALGHDPVAKATVPSQQLAPAARPVIYGPTDRALPPCPLPHQIAVRRPANMESLFHWIDKVRIYPAGDCMGLSLRGSMREDDARAIFNECFTGGLPPLVVTRNYGGPDWLPSAARPTRLNYRHGDGRQLVLAELDLSLPWPAKAQEASHG